MSNYLDLSLVELHELLKTKKINNDREQLNKSLKNYKRKVKNAIIEQMEIIDEIEVL